MIASVIGLTLCCLWSHHIRGSLTNVEEQTDVEGNKYAPACILPTLLDVEPQYVMIPCHCGHFGMNFARSVVLYAKQDWVLDPGCSYSEHCTSIYTINKESFFTTVLKCHLLVNHNIQQISQYSKQISKCHFLCSFSSVNLSIYSTKSQIIDIGKTLHH